MSKASSIIEINGNRYNAVTGQLMDTAKMVAGHAKRAPGNAIDGVSNSVTHNQLTNAKKVLKASSPLVKPKAQTFARNVHQKTQRSKTLMRTVVNKPLKAQLEDNPKPSVRKTIPDNSKRLTRAGAVAKSPHVNRFGLPRGNSRLDTAKNINEENRENKLTLSTKVHRRAASSPELSNISGHQLERLLDHALHRADAHKQSLGGSRRKKSDGHFRFLPRWASMSAGVLILLIVVGFFAWQNVPQVSMKIAASRANIPAAVPDYVPSGFSMAGPIDYSGGVISMNFKANGDSSRTYSLSQQRSNWSSETLAANIIPKGTHEQTAQVKGATVYIYGSSNDTTWVDQGIRYTLTNQAQLNSDQILKIVGSL